MNKHVFQKSKVPEHRVGWKISAILGTFVLVILALNFLPKPEAYKDWDISKARVLETRITKQGYRDVGNARSAAIYYRGEAHVIYIADDRQYDLWLPATEVTTDRNWIALQMSRWSDSSAYVKWNPSKPTMGFVYLH